MNPNHILDFLFDNKASPNNLFILTKSRGFWCVNVDLLPTQVMWIRSNVRKVQHAWQSSVMIEQDVL